jgi:hypothetical protein
MDSEVSMNITLMSINKFIEDNIVWELFSLLVFTILCLLFEKLTGFKNPISLIVNIHKIFKTPAALLKVNRICRGGVGLPTHLADRYIDICLSHNKPQTYGVCYESPIQDRYIISFGGSTYITRYTVEEMDNILHLLGIIEIDRSENTVIPIRNIINKAIYIKCKCILIGYYGDSIKFFADQEDLLKKKKIEARNRRNQCL